MRKPFGQLISCAISLTLGFCLFTGCGNKPREVDYDLSNTENAGGYDTNGAGSAGSAIGSNGSDGSGATSGSNGSDGSGATSGSNSTSGTTGNGSGDSNSVSSDNQNPLSSYFPAHVNEQYSKDNTVRGRVTIDADVILQEDDQYPVVSVSIHKITPSEMANYAKAIFDNDDYFVTLYSYMLDDDGLKSKKEYIQNYLEKFDAEDYPFWFRYELSVIDSYLTENTTDWHDKKYNPTVADWYLLSCSNTEALESSPEYGCQFLGKIDGKLFCLTAINTGGNYSMILHDMENYYPPGYVSANENQLPNKINPCLKNAEESEILATEFLNKLGYTDCKAISNYDCHHGDVNYIDDSEETIADFGHSIIFATSYNGKTSGYPSRMFSSGFNLYTPYCTYSPYVLDDEQVPCYEFIQVVVNDNGVCLMNIVNKLDIKEIKTPSSSLVPMEQILSVFREHTENNEIYTNYYDLKIDRLSLVMYRVSDGSSYSMIPAWLFLTEDEGNAGGVSQNIPAIIINAIDGSVICDMNDEVIYY